MLGLNALELQQFVDEIEELKHESYEEIGTEDYKHLRRTEMYGRVCAVIGYLTIWIPFNPVSILCLSLAQFTRWLLAHHILHRGYDRVPGIPKRYTSKYFARGWRRFIDWFDWLQPDAWDYEHNILHHYYTGEETDPDVVERNAAFIRELPLPRSLKYLVTVLFGFTWKFTYYAPSTISTLKPWSTKRKSRDSITHMTFSDCIRLGDPLVQRLWLECYLPYGLFHFVILPALFLPFGWGISFAVLVNKLLAECLTNLHAYIVILPNHTADDVPRFDFHYDSKAEFYVTQILSSVNYSCGSEFKDYLTIYLNYQIEHHLFPDLTMLGYRRVQPKVKALCQKYGIPYRQENVFIRFKKMLDVCVGAASAQKCASFRELNISANE